MKTGVVRTCRLFPGGSAYLVLLLVPSALLHLFPERAWAPPLPPEKHYTTSAHGESSFGVKRDVAALADYSRGNCSHCHEMHASVGGSEPTPVDGFPAPYALFTDTDTASQTDNFCLRCHTAAGSMQAGGITNANYGSTFGGGPANTTSIAAAMNLAPPAGSSHNLGQVSATMQAKWPSTYNAVSNPCAACHNPHRAKKNNRTGAAYDATQAALSRPSDHENLWGNDATERMDVYAGANTYRAPFFVGANTAVDPTLHEPDGLSRLIASPEVRGSTTPDYNTFCLDCHATAVGPYMAINWNTAQHGFANGNTNNAPMVLRPPYTLDGTSGTGEDLATNFVLSCLDCHEPHGVQSANNNYLLRTTVNGTSGITFSSSTAFSNFCQGCHNHNGHGFPVTAGCGGAFCHMHGGAF